MPKQVHDIKQFIELCRRKDAGCWFHLPICLSISWEKDKEEGDEIEQSRVGRFMEITAFWMNT